MKKFLHTLRLLSAIGYLLLAQATFAQDSLDLLAKLDKGLPPSGLNGSQLGEVIACIGDVNNDGYDDWAVGLPYAADYETGKTIGKIYIYFGGSSIQSNHIPDVVLEGNTDPYGTGWLVAAAGDVNKDGFSDFLVGINGQVALYHGGNPLDVTADVIFTPDDETGSFGTFFSGAGDLNNDGFNDIYIHSEKSICVFLGGIHNHSKADIILKGEQERDGFGSSVSMAGDVNKDGFDDLIIGAQAYSVDGYEGRAYLYYGGAEMDTIADLVLTGEHAGDYFGSSVSDAGDINKDGYDDILVSAYHYQNAGKDPGRVYIYLGGNAMDTAADILINGTEGQSAGDFNMDGYNDLIINKSIYFGGMQMDSIADYTFTNTTRFAGEGDYNNDGYADILTGQPNDNTIGFRTGNVSVFYGAQQLKSSPDLIFYGVPAGDSFGHNVSGLGDLNNDGYDDFVVTAPGIDYPTPVTGNVYIFFGGHTLKHEPDLTFSGKLAESAGDINGDGISDMMVCTAEPNEIKLYLGKTVMNNSPDYTLKAENPGVGFRAIASAGDYNKDGYDDIIVGDRLNSTKGTYTGKVFLYFGGPTIDTNPDLTFDGEAIFNEFGSAVACAGDVNNDGFSDIIIGAPRYENSNRVGRLYIYFGSTTPDTIPDVVITGNKRFRELGEIISPAGDVNNDGYDDIMVSMPYDGNMVGGISYVNIYFGGAVMDTVPEVKIEKTIYRYGSSIAKAGDLNNDGYDDVMVGSIGNATIFYGGLEMDTIPDITIEGEGYWWSGDYGSILSLAGDVNKDGHTDILVGYPSSDAVGGNMGRVYIYSSPIVNTGIATINDIVSHRVYPNPFTTETTIQYNLQKPGKVVVKIFNTSGQEIETLVNASQPSGEYKIKWQPGNLPGGIYFCQIQTNRATETRKMILKRGSGDF